jgi:hypothetical protein
MKRYELQKKRKLRSINAWNRSKFRNRSNVNHLLFNYVMYKLSYYSGKAVIQSWTFPSKALCYWKKSELLNQGLCVVGKFKVEPC